MQYLSKKVEDTEGSGDLKIGIRNRRLRTSDPRFSGVNLWVSLGEIGGKQVVYYTSQYFAF